MKRFFTFLTLSLIITISISSQTLPETYFTEKFEDEISFENWTNLINKIIAEVFIND